MPRNASGVYSLPDSPVVAGTTITSADENTTRGDVASEITNSLDRNGRGGMLAPLQLFDGVLGQPGLTWGSDTNTGIYRSAPDTMVVVVGAQAIATITTSGVAFVGSISASVSLATPTIDSVAGSLVLKGAGTVALTITGANSVFAGSINATSVVSPIVDSGAGALLLKTAGTLRATISTADTITMSAATTGSSYYRAQNTNGIMIVGVDNSSGSDILVGGVANAAVLNSASSAAVVIGVGSYPQCQFSFTATTTRWVSITGSNGGNPTISTTAGDLATGANLRMGGRFLGLASTANTANNLTLGQGNWFGMNGSTQINAIDNSGWTTGSVVTLISYASSFTVKHAQAGSGNFKGIHLNGAADFAMTDQNTLTLGYDGIESAWYEIGRKTGA